jgi:hypothetical protein
MTQVQPALQARSPEFKPHSHHKNKTKQTTGNDIYLYIFFSGQESRNLGGEKEGGGGWCHKQCIHTKVSVKMIK